MPSPFSSSEMREIISFTNKCQQYLNSKGRVQHVTQEERMLLIKEIYEMGYYVPQPIIKVMRRYFNEKRNERDIVTALLKRFPNTGIAGLYKEYQLIMTGGDKNIISPEVFRELVEKYSGTV